MVADLYTSIWKVSTESLVTYVVRTLNLYHPVPTCQNRRQNMYSTPSYVFLKSV